MRDRFTLIGKILASKNWCHRIEKRRWVIVGAVFLTVFLGVGLKVVNERITTWVDSERFCDWLNRETSKGLKLEGRYSSPLRVGLLGLHADSFEGVNGSKTIVSLHAKDISGTFNPLGVWLRRWELDTIHIKSGTVMLQKTDATPGSDKGSPPIPWWGLFWPYRVHLADVKVDDATALWQLRGKESGIYDTVLEITPNGRDFEYDAHGGRLKTPITPPLEVRHAHVLIRKPRLYCSEFLLGDDAVHPEQQLRIEGDAGLQEDRSIKLKIDLASLNVSPWMPETLRTHVIGHASGHFKYASSGTGLETAMGSGNIAIASGILHELAPVRRYITVTGSPDPGDLALKVCRADVRWQEGAMTLENIKMECDGVFRLGGALTIARDQTLRGNIELGLTDPYLSWLPTAKQTIFTRDEAPYHFTTIHFSGTAQKPEQDLSGRISKEVEKSPLLALKLFFNEAGEWFNFD